MHHKLIKMMPSKADLTMAQTFILSMMENANLSADYKAPHAYRPSPPRPLRRISTVLKPRLFKGHRP